MIPARLQPTTNEAANVAVDPHRLTIRTQLTLERYESAVYIVRDHCDEFVREGYTLTAVDELIPTVNDSPVIPALGATKVKAAYCAGPGGKYELSMAEHAALLWSGKYLQAMQQIARGLFPEEVIQKTIGAHVRLHVNQEA